MSIQASLDYEAVNRIEQWVQRLECVGYQIEQAIGKMQPCQKTDVNAGTGATNAKSSPTTTTCTDDTTTAGISTTTPVTPSVQPSQPAEPEAVSKIRRRLDGGGYGLHPTEVDGLLAAYDTLSARLKRAEELLVILKDCFIPSTPTHSQIIAFLAGKGEA